MEEPYNFSAFDDGAETAKPGRGGARDSMMLAATLVQDDQPDVEIPLRVRNVSSGGVMADCASTIERGAKVSVTMRNIGTVAGVVAWARGGRIGVAFEREIDPKAARKPVARSANPDDFGVRIVRSKRPSLRTG